MSRIAIVGMVLILADPASAQQVPAKKPAAGTYKVAFWYEAARPVDSLKYQVYDVGKGEYDAEAVDRWLHEILDKHRDHGAYVRGLSTESEPGATEEERLASAIEREKKRWAELQRRPSAPLPIRIELPRANPRPIARQSRSSFDRPSPGSPGGWSSPAASPFPYPIRNRTP